jgi:peptidyl-prolyl cis-trans isomerase D
MLDALRRHASSWVIKGTLTLIVLTFIFFFGYTEFSSRVLDGQRYIAVVGGTGIPRRRFEATYETTLERLRESMKEEIPENMSQLLRRNVIEQLVTRELIVQYARDLGLRVTEEEIAQAIRSDRSLFPDGSFDLTTYEERFLPYYRQRFGEDFERVMERELLVEQVQTLAQALFAPWREELNSSHLSPEDLLTPWIEGYREKVKVEVFE